MRSVLSPLGVAAIGGPLMAAVVLTAALLSADTPVVPAILVGLAAFLGSASLGLLVVLTFGSLRRQLRPIAHATGRSRDAAGSVGRMAPLVRSLGRQVAELRELLVETSEAESSRALQQAAEASSAPPGALSPALVQATAVDRKQSQEAGRQGAQFTIDPHSAGKLRQLLDVARAPGLPTVGAVAGPNLEAVLAQVADPQPVLPGYGEARSGPNLAYLVVEDLALWQGPWAGASTPAGYALFVQLRDLLERARAQGTATVFVDTGAPAASLTGSLLRHVDVVMHRASGAAASTTVLIAIQSYVRDAGDDA